MPLSVLVSVSKKCLSALLLEHITTHPMGSVEALMHQILLTKYELADCRVIVRRTRKRDVEGKTFACLPLSFHCIFILRFSY